jgi:hypothetical protein
MRCMNNLALKPGVAARLYRNRFLFLAADEQSAGGGLLQTLITFKFGLHVSKVAPSVFICSYVLYFTSLV